MKSGTRVPSAAAVACATAAAYPRPSRR